MQLVGARVEMPAIALIPARQEVGREVDGRHLRAFDGFEGVQWKPLDMISSTPEAKAELEKTWALERAIVERKTALEKMIGVSGRQE